MLRPVVAATALAAVAMGSGGCQEGRTIQQPAQQRQRRLILSSPHGIVTGANRETVERVRGGASSLVGGNNSSSSIRADEKPTDSITPEFSITDEFLQSLDPSSSIEGIGGRGYATTISDQDLVMEVLEDEFEDEEFEDESTSEQGTANQPIQQVQPPPPPLPSMSVNKNATNIQSTSDSPQPLPPPLSRILSFPLFNRKQRDKTAPPTATSAVTTKSSQQPASKMIQKLRPTFAFSAAGPPRFNVELQSSISTKSKSSSRFPRRSTLWREMEQTELTRTTSCADDKAELVMDPKSAMAVVSLLYQVITNASMAFTSTLRLLAPMVVARRILAYMAYVLGDWYTGRYLRKKYEALGQQYWRYYQIPAAFRSLGRIATQALAVTMVGRVAEWVLFTEMAHSCYPMGSLEGCEMSCGFIWICIVLTIGHGVGSFIERSKTPLGIQVCSHLQTSRRNRRNSLLLRPWSLFQLLRDPDSLIRADVLMVRNRESPLRPFTPNPFLFPASWQPLRMMQMIGVAKQMSESTESLHHMMRLVLIQEVLRSEWYRVLMVEKRVALGIAVVVMYTVATLTLFFTVGEVSGPSALLLLPSVLAVLVSAWMNVFVYSERRNKKRSSHGDETKRIASGLT